MTLRQVLLFVTTTASLTALGACSSRDGTCDASSTGSAGNAGGTCSAGAPGTNGSSGTAGSTGASTSSQVAVTVAPSSADVRPGGSVAFVASVAGTAWKDVIWSVAEPDGGRIGASGDYTAPGTDGTYHVVATSRQNPSASATSVVTVQSAAVGASSLPSSPPTVSQFAASPGGVPSGASTTLSWTVVDATSVSIDNGIGAVGSSGSTPVSPSSATTYTLTAANSNGTTKATVSVAVGGTAYYVDAWIGDDSSSGTSQSTAWRTISRVSMATFGPGDVVAFRRGQAFSDELFIRQSGTQDLPIRLTSYGSGDRPILDSGGAEASIRFAESTSWVVIEDLMLEHGSQSGVLISTNSSHNVVRNCEISDVGYGVTISAGASDNLVTGNNIHDLHMILDTTHAYYGGVMVGIEGPHNEISYNTGINLRAQRSNGGWDGGVIELWGPASDNYVHHNWIDGTYGFVEASTGGLGSQTGNIFAYNVIVNNYSDFITVHVSPDLYGLRVENNVNVSAPGSQSFPIWFGEGTPNASTIALRNNIVVQTGVQGVAISDGFTHDHNIYWSYDGATHLGALSLGDAELVADPGFVNFAANDFHLISGSPARGSGVDLGYPCNFDGLVTAASQAPDIGAF